MRSWNGGLPDHAAEQGMLSHGGSRRMAAWDNDPQVNGVRRPLHWRAYLAELFGTFLLIFLGLSVVIYDFSPLSPVTTILPSSLVRRLLTGFLFGGTGALVAVSPIGKISGAHLDPVLSWGFWLAGSLSAADAALYTVAQFLGALGAGLLLPPVWGAFGRAALFGATVPGPTTGPWLAVTGEIIATFGLVGGIVWFVGHPRLRPYTPALIPPLVAVLVALEAPWSGTSMNPARTLGPAIPSHTIAVFWVYLLGPAVGALLAALIATHPQRTHVAKISHHDHDPLDRFHGSAAGSLPTALRRFCGRWLRTLRKAR